MISTIILGEVYQLIKIIGIVAIVYVFFNFAKGYYKEYNRIKIFFILFICFNFFSLIWSDNYDLWQKNLINLISLSFDFMLLVTLSAKANNPVRSIIYGWATLVLCSIPFALFELLTNIHFSSTYADKEVYIGGNVDLQKKFAAVAFGNINSYTTLLCIALPFISSLFFSKIKFVARLFVLALILVIIYIILINSSRGGILSLGAIGFIFLCFYWRYLRKTVWGIFIGLTIVLLAYYCFDSVIEQFEQRLNFKGEAFSADESRSNMLEYGIYIFLSSPLGVGIGNIEYYYSQYPTGGLFIPHNMIMEFLLYGGIFFFSFFFFWFIKTYLRGFRSDSKIIRFIFKASAASFIPMMVINSGYFLIPYVWIFLASLYILSNTKLYDDKLF